MNKTFTNRILGSDIAVTNLADAIALINDQKDKLSGQYIAFITVDDLIQAQDDPKKSEYIKNAAMAFPVNESIAWIQRLRGFKTAESINPHKLEEKLSGIIADYDIRLDKSGNHSHAATIKFLIRCIPDAFKWKKKREDDKKDLLIYAHYYYPDVASTGQILTELAEGLNETFHTTVICTVPSYTGQIDKYYKKHKYYYENINGVDILRIRVPEFRKNFSPSRIINIVSYFFGAIFATTRVGHQDYIYTISQPPVLGGLLGIFGKLLKRGKLIYNIQDFNPEQVKAVSFTSNKFVLGTMMMLDKFSCKVADKVIVVGRDMIDTLRNRFPDKMPVYAHINNWINEKEIVPLARSDIKVQEFKEKYGLKDKFVIM